MTAVSQTRHFSKKVTGLSEITKLGKFNQNDHRPQVFELTQTHHFFAKVTGLTHSRHFFTQSDGTE